jgi:hypothetical protein
VYRKLLASDWTVQSLDHTLILLWKELGHPKSSFLSEEKTLDGNQERSQRIDAKGIVVSRIQGFMDTLGIKTLPPVPVKLPVREWNSSSLWRQRAEETWTLLIFQSLENLVGEADLFRDTQSILFLVARHFLLPALKSRHMRPEHDLLINAMYMHIMLTWQDFPSHQYYLKSILMDYLDLEEEARKSLLAAFETTSPQDHDFLSKAQAYWSYLLDGGHYDKAEAFLLQLYRTAPSPCLEEIQEMIKDLFQFLLAKKAAI